MFDSGCEVSECVNECINGKFKCAKSREKLSADMLMRDLIV